MVKSRLKIHRLKPIDVSTGLCMPIQPHCFHSSEEKVIRNRNRTAMALLMILALGLVTACTNNAYTPIVNPTQPIDPAAYAPKVDAFVIVFDNSSSMTGKYQGRLKVRLGQDFVATFNNAIPAMDVQAGLVTFGNDSGICFGGASASVRYGMVTYQAADLARALESIQCAGGITPMSKGIDATGKILASQTGAVAVIIVSDFLNIDEPSVSASIAQLRSQLNNNVCIHTVKVGDSTTSNGLISSISGGAGCNSAVNAVDITTTDMSKYVADTLMAPLQYEKHTISATALFDFDKAELKEQGKAQLRILAEDIKSRGPSIGDIDVIGYTDSIGTVAYNQALSEQRAAAVKAYLISVGVNGGIIDAIGRGESDPVATNMYKDGRAKNRRVEIHVGTARLVK